MKRINLLVFTLLTGNLLNAQLPSVNWGLNLGMHQTSMAASSAEGTQAVTDASGNIYTVGFFSGATNDLDPGVNNIILSSELTPGGFSSEDIFITKHNTSGGLIWAKQIGGENIDIANGLATDGYNIYVTGSYSGTVDFDPGNDTTYLYGNSNIFVIKINSSGDLVYARSMGGTGNDEGRSIDVDASGNVVVTGSFSGTADFDPGVANVDLVSGGGTDVFIAKLNNAGDLVWVKQLNGDGDDYAAQIILDPSNNILVTGTHHSNQIDLDPGLVYAYWYSNSPGTSDVFWVKLDNNGDYKWGRAAGTDGSDYAYGITSDALGNVYSVGTFWGTNAIDFGGGNTLTTSGYVDTYITRMDTSGAVQWVKAITGSSLEEGFGIYVDLAANVYLTGAFQGVSDFDPDTGTAYLAADLGAKDMFIAKYTNQGNYLWAQKYGGANHQLGYKIILDNTSSDLILTGTFMLELVLDSTTLYTPGPPSCIRDMFLSKIAQPVNNSGIQNLTNTNSLLIYPNPATDFITIETQNISGLYIYNSIGSILMTKNTVSDFTLLNIADWAPGIYFIQTNTGQTHRFIKQ